MNEILQKIDNLLTSVEAKATKMKSEEAETTANKEASRVERKELEDRTSVLNEKLEETNKVVDKIKLERDANAAVELAKTERSNLQSAREEFDQYVKDQKAKLAVISQETGDINREIKATRERVQQTVKEVEKLKENYKAAVLEELKSKI